MNLEIEVEAVLDRLYGKYVATAVKRGKNPRWPYVPVVKNTDITVWRGQTHNPAKGEAFATREEAIARAQAILEARRAADRALFLEPLRGRAMRRYHGLPMEIA